MLALSAIAQPAPSALARVSGSTAIAVANASGAGNAATGDAADAHRIIDFMPYSASNSEQGRRSATVVFHDELQGRPNNFATLSASQSVLLLKLADWDIGQALDEWTGLDNAFYRLHIAFGRMRSPEDDKVAQYKRGRPWSIMSCGRDQSEHNALCRDNQSKALLPYSSFVYWRMLLQCSRWSLSGSTFPYVPSIDPSG